eukprot:jgi/Chrzof1/8167/Cz03g00070.t1
MMSHSLPIHIPQCQQKWVRQQNTQLAGQHRPLPPTPDELADGGVLPKTKADIEIFNAKMFDIYNQLSLVPCGVCGRTFRPEALVIHARSCRTDATGSATSAAKTIKAGNGSTAGKNGPAYKAIKKPGHPATAGTKAGRSTTSLSKSADFGRIPSTAPSSTAVTPNMKLTAGNTAAAKTGGAYGRSNMSASADFGSGGISQKPRGYVCCLCGQQYGSKR